MVSKNLLHSSLLNTIHKKYTKTFMYYTEYKEASIRHLNTCRHLIANIFPIVNPITERNLLLNLYYLSGYTIECIVNYAIYDYIRFNPMEDVKNLNIKSNPFCVSFYRTKQNIPRFVIQTHKFQFNCQFFSQQGITDATKIPHFDGLIPDISLVPLFDSWKPEVRYVDCGFSKNEIINFFKLSEEIHTLTRYYITKN